MFNPRIVRASRAKAHRWESCLSIPDQMGLVERARSVEIEFEDIEGLELCLSWACAVGTASLNTVAFLAAPPARRSMYIELELLTDAELYSTYAVVG